MGYSGGAGNSRPYPAAAGMNGAWAEPTTRKGITASQVTGVLKQAQTFQTQGRFNDAIDLCEQILHSGFDRPDTRYFLGWLYQEQHRWEEAISQFQTLLDDPDYALSCYYALGQCYRSYGDLQTASVHFDEAVDRVNLDALTLEESDQLVQLCEEAAEAHHLLGEQEQALIVYNALMGFLHSRGWSDKVAQVESMFKELEYAKASTQIIPPLPPTTPPATPFVAPTQDRNPTRAPLPEQLASIGPFPIAPVPSATNTVTQSPPVNGNGELPPWLSGAFSDPDKTQIAHKRPSSRPELNSERMATPTSAQPAHTQSAMVSQPTIIFNPAIAEVTDAKSLLSQMAGPGMEDRALEEVTDSVLASTSYLPENIRLQVAQSMQDIQKYINFGLLTRAAEECLRVVDIAPQYLDVHQVLSEIYIRQGLVEEAIIKYAILIETYLANGRTDDAIATYRRILQLEPDNLTYRGRLIYLLSSKGNKEELLQERSLAAEAYLRLGYMERAVTELAQALQESPSSVSTRLNYALALQKLGRSEQAIAEYQHVLQVDPRNVVASVHWHIAMITGKGAERAIALEALTRIRWQLRAEGLRNYEMVAREYSQTAENYPHNADVHFALGQMHQQAGNFDKAIDSYKSAMWDNSFAAIARVSASHCLLTQGQVEAAIQQLEQTLQSVRHSSDASIDPDIWAARPREEGEEHQAPEVEISTLLAKAYGRAGRRDDMEATMRQVRQMTTYKDELASTLAEISARHENDIDAILQEYAEHVHQYRNKRQTENALIVLNQMVRMAPQDPRAHAELGDIYVGRGLLEEGIAELRLFADICLQHDQKEAAADALQRIGSIYAQMENNEEALIHLRRAIELDPNDMNLLREVVGFCWPTGNTKEAIQYQTIIARHYFDTQQVKESVAALQQLISLDRHSYEAYDMLGKTYESVGEYEQAIRVYKNLAKVNPQGTIARERLTALQELRATHS